MILKGHNCCKEQGGNLVRWHRPRTLVFKRLLRQEHHEIGASLGYTVRSCFRKSSEKWEPNGEGR